MGLNPVALAQSGRASGCEPEGYGFESRESPHSMCLVPYSRIEPLEAHRGAMLLRVKFPYLGSNSGMPLSVTTVGESTRPLFPTHP